MAEGLHPSARKDQGLLQNLIPEPVNCHDLETDRAVNIGELDFPESWLAGMGSSLSYRKAHPSIQSPNPNTEA